MMSAAPQRAGQARPVAVRAFDAEAVDLSQARDPVGQLLVAM